MTSVFFITKTILTALIYIFILRLWMHYVRVSFYNPFTQFIVKITQPILTPLKTIIPTSKQVDFSAVVVIYLLALLKVIFIFTYGFGAAVWNNSYLLYALGAAFSSVGHLLFWLLLIRAILSWITRGQTYADDILAQLTEPLVTPIRRFIPPFGFIDLSFMVIVFILFALNLVAYDVFGSVWNLLS